MSGAMRRFGEYLGLLEDTGRYADDGDVRDTGGYDRYQGDDEHTQNHQAVPPVRSGVRREVRPAPVADLAERRRPVATNGPTGLVAELSRITTVHPRTYNEARTVGEHFRDGIPVIMNLTEMSDSDAKRLVDFAAGLVFATRGTIERVTNRVFLLSPPNVTVAAEDKQRIAEGGFFNQS
jgi:cell division inhibitor SepF